MSTLSVIVPVYNEERFLSSSLDRLLASGVADEIIISDDGSTDNSINIAKDYAGKYKNIKLLLSETNRGKGEALTVAKDKITSDFVTIHDADLEYFPEDLHSMYQKIQEHPNSLVIGSRFIGNVERKNIYKRTKVANKAISLFFSLIHFKKVTDIATCYKMCSSEHFRELDLIEKGFSVEVEIVAKSLKGSKQLFEVPIQYHGRSYEEGKKITLIDGFKYIIKTVKYRF